MCKAVRNLFYRKIHYFGEIGSQGVKLFKGFKLLVYFTAMNSRKSRTCQAHNQD